MVNFLFCYGSLLLMDMQWVFLGKRPIFIKVFLEETFIWQCRLLKLTFQCCVLSAVCDMGEGFVHTSLRGQVISLKATRVS